MGVVAGLRTPTDYGLRTTTTPGHGRTNGRTGYGEFTNGRTGYERTPPTDGRTTGYGRTDELRGVGVRGGRGVAAAVLRRTTNDGQTDERTNGRTTGYGESVVVVEGELATKTDNLQANHF